MNSVAYKSRLTSFGALVLLLALVACGAGGGADAVVAAPTVAADTTAPLVIANPGGGTFSANQSVALSANEAASIYYTTNGATPTTTSTPYTGPIFISTNTNLRFIARDTAGNLSSLGNEAYTFAIDSTLPTVVSAPGGGTYDAVQFVTLSPSETANIYYTTDGSVPTTSSSLYSTPITISATTTLRYFARDTAGNSGGVTTQTYTIDSSLPTVVASPSGGSLKGTQFVTLVSNKPGTIYYTLDGSNPSTASAVYYSPIRINPNATTTLKFFARDRLGNSSTLNTQAYTTGGAITDVKITNTGAAQTNVPVTFGQVFAKGDIPAASSVIGRLENDSAISLQVNAKATHSDGSLRHAIISTVLPSLASGQTETIYLHRGAAGSTTAITPAALIAAGFNSSISLTLSGVTYTASPATALNTADYSQWLQGPIANEWIVKAPLLNGAVPHPHLIARFAIRAYPGSNKVKVDVIVENNWAYEPGPQNFTYSVNVLLGGVNVYFNPALTHYHHARWRKTFWWNGVPAIHVSHNSKYLIESRALPHYDSSIAVSSSALSNLASSWAAANTSPMGNGLILPYFPTTGGRGDIGPMPSWSAMYLLSMNETSKVVTLGVGDLAGSFQVHYRDKTTDRPVSLIDHPRMTISGGAGDAGPDIFPACGAGGCATPYEVDDAHQPSLAYLPYIVTGDYYYLEELQFWANYNMLKFNPTYRDFEKGLLRDSQIRGQAWSLRTLGQVAFITPDSHPFKSYFVDRVNNNINFYHSTFVVGTPKNNLGYLDNSGAFSFFPFVYAANGNTVDNGIGIASWQDDFFTWSVGHLVDLGFSSAQPFLEWKAKFPIGRMTASGYCWIDAAVYSFVGRSTNTAPLYTTFSEAFAGTTRNPDGTPWRLTNGTLYADQPCASQAMANWRTQFSIETGESRSPWQAGEMSGFAGSTSGFPSNMQPALAAATRTAVPNAKAAWAIFANRTVQPNYQDSPQWAVVPWNQ